MDDCPRLKNVPDENNELKSVLKVLRETQEQLVRIISSCKPPPFKDRIILVF
jgi:hypothetical protein